jgi:hypothetical protein
LQGCRENAAPRAKGHGRALLQWRHDYTAAEVVWSQSWIRPDVKRILLGLF